MGYSLLEIPYLLCDFDFEGIYIVEPISSWFRIRIRIHGFRFGFAVSYLEVEYETGKFESDSLVF